MIKRAVVVAFVLSAIFGCVFLGPSLPWVRDRLITHQLVTLGKGIENGNGPMVERAFAPGAVLVYRTGDVNRSTLAQQGVSRLLGNAPNGLGGTIYLGDHLDTRGMRARVTYVAFLEGYGELSGDAELVRRGVGWKVSQMESSAPGFEMTFFDDGDTDERQGYVSLPIYESLDDWSYGSLKTSDWILIPEATSLEEKLHMLAIGLSQKRFGGLPILVMGIEIVEDKTVVLVDLRENEDWRPWIVPAWNGGYLEGSTGGRETAVALIETVLQREYEGPWVDGATFFYEGEQVDGGHAAGLFDTHYRATTDRGD